MSQHCIEGCPSLKAPSNTPYKCGLLFPLFGGCTATILCGLPYPKILCAPEKGERKKERKKEKKKDRKKENGDITWCRSSLLRAWVAEIVT